MPPESEENPPATPTPNSSAPPPFPPTASVSPADSSNNSAPSAAVSAEPGSATTTAAPDSIDPAIAPPAAHPPDPFEKRRSFSDGNSGLGLLIFFVGLGCGLPAALLAPPLVNQYGGQIIATIVIVLLAAAVGLALIYLLRGTIFRWLLRRGGIEVRQLASPLAELAQHAAARRLPETTAAARQFAEMALARYAWLSTRRWLIASITALIAAVAALAGSALLYEQNRLLRYQSELLVGQNQRIDDQTTLLTTQNALSEADRNATLGSDLIALGADLSAALSRNSKTAPQGHASVGQLHHLEDLPDSLIARFVAASQIARPYRFLAPSAVEYRDQGQVNRAAVAHRTDLQGVRQMQQDFPTARESASLIDRALSPERGQILAMLLNHGIHDFDLLTARGADFSSAEIRVPQIAQLSLRQATLTAADFSFVPLGRVDFGGAFMQLSRFRSSQPKLCDFSSIGEFNGDQFIPGPAHRPLPFEPGNLVATTQLSGADFSDAIISQCLFGQINGLGLRFDRAVLAEVIFNQAQIAASSFRDAILHNCNFDGADLTKVDFDGAWVFRADFLELTSAQTSQFDPSFFRIEAQPVQALETHPNYNNFTDNHIPQAVYAGPVWRVRRIKDFE